jgi:hypothetical protein
LIETNTVFPSQVTDRWCVRQGSGITHRIGGRQELSGFFHAMYVFPRL